MLKLHNSEAEQVSVAVKEPVKQVKLNIIHHAVNIQIQ